MSSLDQTRAPLRKANLASLAHDEILRRITVGELREGEKIVLHDLARSLGVSPIPIREALSRLSAERTVTYEPNRGFRVAPALGPDEVADLFEARLVLELGALEVGMAQVTDAMVAELSLINDRIRRRSYGPRFEDFADFILDNARFHAILVGLPGNPLVQEAYDRLGYHQRIPRTMHGRGIVDAARIVEEHDAIVAALRARDRDGARAALRAHIVDAYDRLPMREAGRAFRPLQAQA